jgi:phospholipase/lecithinase/hemolysin
MNIKLLLSKLLLVSLLMPLGVSATDKPIKNVFVFGDSLSDTGNLASLSPKFPQYNFLKTPPYNHGFTNGLFAVEVLAKYLHLEVKPSLHLTGSPQGTNYAVAGATAGGTGDSQINLTSQVVTFLSYQPNHSAPKDALYIIFIGGNDVKDALDTPGKSVIKNAVQAVDDNIRALIVAGAKAILVVNVPDLGLTPRERDRGKKVAKQASHLTNEFNDKLLAHLNNIEKALHVDIISFDLYQLSHIVTDNSIGMGYTNSTQACFDSTNFVYVNGCHSRASFEDYFYFDDFHPTEATHKRIGRALYSVVPELPEVHEHH